MDWGILWARLVERSGRLTWSGWPKQIARELLQRAVADVQKLKVGMYESIFWQHRMLNLCYVVWLDNNKVNTLSNFHSPDVLEVGLGMLRKMRVDKKGTGMSLKCHVLCK